MFKKFKKKGKFDDLPPEWKDKADSLSDLDLDVEIATVSKLEEENQAAKDADVDLHEQKERYHAAAEGYKEATRMNKLKIKYSIDLLKARGKA